MNDKLLIRLALRVLGGALRHRLLYRNDAERYRAAKEELFGVWRSALTLGCYDATDAIEEMIDTADHLSFEERL